MLPPLKQVNPPTRQTDFRLYAVIPGSDAFSAQGGRAEHGPGVVETLLSYDGRLPVLDVTIVMQRHDVLHDEDQVLLGLGDGVALDEILVSVPAVVRPTPVDRV